MRRVPFLLAFYTGQLNYQPQPVTPTAIVRIPKGGDRFVILSLNRNLSDLGVVQ
jgi:hypothetical protein